MNRSKSGQREKATKITGLLDIKNYVSYEAIARNLSFMIFLAGLAMLYIWNTYQSEKMNREINETNQKLKELRWEYMSKKSELMFKSKQSEVAKYVSESGLKEMRNPPNIMTSKEDEQ